jgi:NTE family protein
VSVARSLSDTTDPVRWIPGDDEREAPSGMALCLSGGGYRAMLFHLGVLRRLNEGGVLPQLSRVSSVSGGSIVAAVLGRAWEGLDFDDAGVSAALTELVEAPVRELARHTLDIGSVLQGLVSPELIGEKLADAYREHLFGDALMSDLPVAPRFIINATNVDSGELIYMSRAYLSDWRVGWIADPRLDLAVAVACSSAFPPVLSPFRIPLADAAWQDEPWNDLSGPEHRDKVVATDGGVYDNLGLETAWKRCRTLIVSDAGGHLAADPDPDSDWPRHILRVLKLIDNQVRALRKQQLIGGFERGERDGVYLGIRSDITHYELEDALPAPHDITLRLAEIPTRLQATDEATQERLINWGYAVCDAGVRRHLGLRLDPPAWPYPEAGLS